MKLLISTRYSHIRNYKFTDKTVFVQAIHILLFETMHMNSESCLQIVGVCDPREYHRNYEKELHDIPSEHVFSGIQVFYSTQISRVDFPILINWVKPHFIFIISF